MKDRIKSVYIFVTSKNKAAVFEILLMKHANLLCFIKVMNKI